MSQGFGDNDQGSAHSTSREAAQRSTELLKTVLEATLARGQNAITAEELDALREAAKSNSSGQMPLQEVALLLVRTFLTARFKDRLEAGQTNEARQQSLDAMCKSIAETLCGDPNSAIRLTQLWKLLHESNT